MKISTFVIFVSLVTEGWSGPILDTSKNDQTSCAIRCTDTSKFNFVPGMTYEFEYNVQTQTSMEGASSERATLGIRATANIEVLTKCDLALTLRDVKVYRSDPSSSTPMKYADETGEFKRNLERFPIRFSFQDGVVEELCPSEGESTWALNIKRGLLTAIQNSISNLETDQTVNEIDVTGECNTDYKVENQGWFSTTIKKTKDLLACINRNGYYSTVHAMPYRVPSEIQSLPLMKSTHECEQELDNNGLLKSALIRETHTFRPFSQASSGATTKILQQLNYKTQRSGVSTGQEIISRRLGLMFEHENGIEGRSLNIRGAENKLREICRNTQEDIRPDTPVLFSELVVIVKNLDGDNLRSVYQHLKQGTLCSDNNARVKKIFLDSLPMVGTSASVQFMKMLLLNKDVIGAQATMWITSLSFIHYPTLEMLLEIKPLLDSPQYSKSAMLPISTMINNYCNHHESCSEEYAVTNIIYAMEKVIGNGCYVRESNQEDILLALRALGNAGHLQRMTTTLSSCLSRQRNPTEVRVTAIQAYRRLPCTADRCDMMNIYQNSDEDSEIRITAYLAVMECPSGDVLNTIQEIMEEEKNNQVGSFVWTHLTNLLESSSPYKQSIKQIIKDKRQYRPFDLDRLKYSRNYEGSVFWEKFNMGGMLDSNLIFSEKSSIPRSLSLNMTVDLFGSSLNLLELGGRIEGLEYMMHTYLDESNFFRTWMMGKGKTKLNRNNLRGNLYMRMFGNEIYYNQFKGTDPVATVKEFNILDMLIQMSKNKDYSFTQSAIILDSSMIIPTSSGMPLNLTVNGTATIDLQASGQVDLRKLTTSPKSMLIGGILKPSGAVQVTGTMSMDAFVTKSGLRVMNTWHSSTALKGRVELNRGKILNVELDFPQKKMEILDVSTAFFGIHGDQEKKQDLLTENRKTLELCTGSRLATITGLELCNEFQWTNASMKADAPYFPFTGPFSQSLILYKRDTHTGYKLMAKRTKTKGLTTAMIALDTPGSKTDRSIDVSFVFNDKANDKEVKLTLLSPWKEAKLEGSVVYNKKKLGMSCKMITDRTKEYSIISEVGIKKVKNLVTYKPRVEIKRPGAKAILLSGQVSTEGLENAHVNLALRGVKSHDITFKGAISNIKNKQTYKGSIKGSFSLDPGQYYSSEADVMYKKIERRETIITVIPTLTIKTPKYDLVSLTGSSEYRKGNSLKGKISLDMPKLMEKPFTMECNLHRKTGRRTKYTGNLKLSSDVLVSKMSGNILRKKATTTTSFMLDYNLPNNRNIKADKMIFKSKSTDRSTKFRWDYKLNLHFSAKRRPHLNLMTEAEVSHYKRQTEVDVNVKYGPKSRHPSNHVTVYSLIHHDVTKDSVNIDYNMKFGLKPKNLDSQLEGKYIHSPRSLSSTTTLTYGNKAHNRQEMKKLTMDIMISNNGTTQRGSFGTTVNIQTPFQGYQNLTVHAECNRLADKIRSLGKVSWGSEKGIIIDVSLRRPSASDESFQLNVESTSTHKHFRRLTAAFSILPGPKYVQMTTNVILRAKKNIEADMEFNLRHASSRQSLLEFKADVKTQYSGYERTYVKYDQSLNQAMISPNVKISMEAQTPFKMFNISKIMLTHDGPLNNCQSYLSVNMMGYVITADTVLRFGNSVIARVSAVSNINGFENISANLNFQKTSSNFTAIASAFLLDDNIDVSVIAGRNSSHNSASFYVRTPFKNFRVTGLKVECSKSWYKNSSASLTYMDDKTISWRLENNRFRKYGKRRIIELKTPFKNFEIYSLEVEEMFHKEHFLNITILYGIDKKITLDTVIEDENKIFQISFIITTPFVNHEFSTIFFRLNGTKDDFRGFMGVEFSGTKINVLSTFNEKKWKFRNGSLLITTNIKNYENITGNFQIYCCKSYLNATSTLAVNEETVQTVLVIDKDLLDFTIKTPFTNYKNIGCHFYRSDLNETDKIIWILSIPYMDGKEITANITTIDRPVKQLIVEMATPFKGYEYQAIYITDAKIPRCCNGKVGLKIVHSDGETIEIAVVYELKPNYHLNVSVLAEDTEGQIHIAAEMEDYIPVSAEFFTELQLPYEGYERQLIRYKHSFQNGSIDGSLDLVKIEGTDLSISVSGMNTVNAVKGKITMATNVNGLEHTIVMFTKEGDLNNLKVTGGVQVLDFQATVYHLQSSRPRYINSSLSFNRERPILLTLNGQIVSENAEGEMFVNWNRDEPDSNVRILTTITDKSRKSNTDKKLKVKLIHSSQSLALEGNILRTKQRASSHGEFIWNEDTGRKIFYNVDVKDRSRRESKMYDGTLKVGYPSRSLQMDGSYRETGMTKIVDGCFYWDADRDTTKQVGVKAVVTPGIQNKKADLSFKLPSIGKDIIVVSEMAMDDGRTLFRAKTKLSYSSDTRKTIILTTRLDDLSRGYTSSNYSLEVGISHPYTDVDVKMISHLGTSGERYSGGMDLLYLTDWKDTKTFALRGEISKAMNKAELLITSPLQKMAFSGEIQRHPYKVLIRNKYGDLMMYTDFLVDTENSLIELQTTYDIDDPSKSLLINASYLNSNRAHASVYHKMNSNLVLDGLLNVRLNASRLLHTRFFWRPQIVVDVQAFLTSEVEKYGQKTKDVFHSVYEAVGQELSGKYFRITQAVSDEATPYMTLLETEMAAFERELDSIRRDIRRMYRRNQFIVKHAGEYLDQANKLYKKTLTSIASTVTTSIRKLTKTLEKMKNYPIRDRYDELLSGIVKLLKHTADKVITEANEAIGRLDDKLLSAWQTTQQQVVTMQNTATNCFERVVDLPRIIDNNLQISNSISPYLNSMYTTTAETYGTFKDMLRGSGEGITAYMVDAKQREDLKLLYTLTNEIYQEGVSAYKQLKNQGELDNNIRLVPDVLEQRADNYVQDTVFYYRPKVTVWDPENGEAQVEFYLPIPLKYLHGNSTRCPTFYPAGHGSSPKILAGQHQQYFPTLLWERNKTV